MSGAFLRGFLDRVACAILLSLYVALVAVIPLDLPRWILEPMYAVAKWLDLPVALLSHLRIPHISGIDLWFNACRSFIHPERVPLWHLKLSVPLYVLLFYVPALGRTIMSRVYTPPHGPLGQSSTSDTL